MQLITVAVVLAALGAGAAAQCNCQHNNDAGRWRDDNSPAAVAQRLIDANGGCYTAKTQGHMCVSFNNANDAVKTCLRQEASNDQSWHGDWFLWTSITCEDGSASGTISSS